MVMAPIWQELLGIKSIGIRDNFFELGGHSLMATQVLSRITERLGVTVPLADFFGLSTIEKLGEYVDGAVAPRSDPMLDGQDLQSPLGRTWIPNSVVTIWPARLAASPAGVSMWRIRVTIRASR